MEVLATKFQTDNQILIEEIKEHGLNPALHLQPVFSWLDNWISQQERTQGIKTANTFLKNNFCAMIGLKEGQNDETINPITQAFTKMQQQRAECLKQIAQNPALFHGESPENLSPLKNALMDARSKETATEGPIDEAAEGQAYMQLSELYQEIVSKLPEGATPDAMYQEFKTALEANRAKFSNSFMSRAAENLDVVIDHTENFYKPLITARSQNGLLGFLVAQLDDKSSAELTITSDNLESASKEAERFIAQYSHEGIANYSSEQIQHAISEGFKGLSDDAQKFLVLRAREGQNIIDIRQEAKTTSIGALLKHCNLSQLAGMGIVGMLIGQFFGSTMIGLLLAGVLGLAGDGNTPSNHEAPKNNLLKPPASKSRSEAPVTATAA